MAAVVGIDPSSKKLAFCVTEPGCKPVVFKLGLPEGVLQATGAAFEEAFLFFSRLSRSNPRVYMEAPLVGRSAYSTIVQAQVGGAVMAAACRSGTYLKMVNVNSWKKKVVGKGNATKEDVSAWLKDNWKMAYTLCSGDQDLIDASALNRYGHRREKVIQTILGRSAVGREG
jgi:hypothetical protein